MMRKHLKESESSDKNFIILEGASYLDEFGYEEELMSLDENNNNVTFEASVSRPDEERNNNWEGYKGRVNNILLERLEEWGLNPSETIVYACGHPGMIEDVNEKLKNTDYTFLEERFWKD